MKYDRIVSLPVRITAYRNGRESEPVTSWEFSPYRFVIREGSNNQVFDREGKVIDHEQSDLYMEAASYWHDIRNYKPENLIRIVETVEREIEDYVKQGIPYGISANNTENKPKIASRKHIGLQMGYIVESELENKHEGTYQIKFVPNTKNEHI